MNATPLPHNPDSERVACSFVFLYPEAAGELAARGFIADWLHLPANRILWRILTEYRSKVQDPREINAVSLISGLLSTPSDLADIGGPSAITELADSAVIMSPDLLDYHVAILRTAWQRRQALATAARLEAAATSGNDFDEALASSITDLGNLSSGVVGSRLINGADALADFVSDLQAQATGEATTEAPPLKTGIGELDDKIGGLIHGFWLVGADTSGGKTALSLQLVRSVLNQGGRALVFALEMSARQLVRRIVSAEGRIPMQRLIRPETLIEYDFTNLTTRGTNWNASNLIICDDGDVTIQEARSIARAEHAREPLSLVVVDYIQLASAGRFKDGANREQEVSFIGSQCVKMAKELRLPVIAPTQLNDDGKVRESRALKHHASVYLVIEEDRILCAKGRDAERNWELPYRLTGDIQTFEHIN